MEKTAAKKKNKMTAAEKAGFVARLLMLIAALVLIVIGALMMDAQLGWALLGNVIMCAGMVVCWFSFKRV